MDHLAEAKTCATTGNNEDYGLLNAAIAIAEELRIFNMTNYNTALQENMETCEHRWHYANDTSGEYYHCPKCGKREPDL